MMIDPVRVTSANQVRVINAPSCLFIPFTAFLHLHCLLLPFSCLYCLFIYCSYGFIFFIQYINCYCHPLYSKVVICILLICITVIIRSTILYSNQYFVIASVHLHITHFLIPCS